MRDNAALDAMQITFLSKNLISKAKGTLVNHSGYKVFTHQLNIHTCARLLCGIFLKSFVILMKSLLNSMRSP